MLRGLEPREVTELLAFYDAEPFGEQRADLRNALGIANLLAPHLKKGVRLELEKFMPYRDRPKQSSKDVAAAIAGFFQGMKKHGDRQ